MKAFLLVLLGVMVGCISLPEKIKEWKKDVSDLKVEGELFEKELKEALDAQE